MNEETFALRDVLRVLRHHRWKIMAAVILAVLAALVVSYAQPKHYTAETQLVVGPAIPDAALPDAPSGNDAGPLGLDLPAETQARVLASPMMTARVFRSFGRSPNQAQIEELTRRVQAKAVTDNLLLITAQGPSARQAAAIANRYASEYLDYRREAAVKALQSLPEDFQRRAQRAAGSQASGYSGGQIIAPATPQATSSSPNPIRNVLIAVVLGGAAGVSIALLREHVDDRVRTRDQAARAANALVLAALPRRRRQARAQLITVDAPETMASEAYRQLHRHLVRRGLGTQVRRLLVTSVEGGMETSETVANLGVLSAWAGQTTMAIAADLRHSRLHSYFGIPDGPRGLATELAAAEEESPSERASMTLTSVSVTEQNLLVLPSGGTAGHSPGALFSSARVDQVFSLAAEMAQLVIIEAPPILGSDDAITLTAYADATLLVVRAGVDKEALTARAAAIVETAGSMLLGVVLHNAQKDDETVGLFSRHRTEPEHLPPAIPSDVTWSPPQLGNGHQPGEASTLDPEPERPAHPTFGRRRTDGG
jgi:Mrp family chromosome partitioning ATPase/capsular polysaccharide biosynthesis protein